MSRWLFPCWRSRRRRSRARSFRSASDTKPELDKVCAANGGTSYGDESAYGCTKGRVSVECDKTGKCNAYVNIVASPGTQVSVPDLLQQQSAVLQHGMTTGANAGVTGGTANVSQ